MVLTNERAYVVKHGWSSCQWPLLVAQLHHQLRVALILLSKQVELLLLVAA